MAKFEEEKVINALHPEKAIIGKEYYFSDDILKLKKYVEKNDVNHIGKLIDIMTNNNYPFDVDNVLWQSLYPYEELSKRKMTNIQLIEWLSKGNGILRYSNSINDYCCNYVPYIESELNNEVEKGILIRTWDGDEWVEPTIDIYERDCKGGKK